MESAAERLYRELLLQPGLERSQRELARRARFTPGYASQQVKFLVEQGVLARPFRNRVVVTSPVKLLFMWAARRVLPQPTYVQTKLDGRQIERSLMRFRGVALTLFSGAWHRDHFFQSRTSEAYVPTSSIPAVANRLGKISPHATVVALYPSEGPELRGSSVADGPRVVSIPQNVVDLMAFGGQGPRVGIHLARTGGLLGD